MKILLKSLKALADGNRLRILRLLMDRPRCVCELQAALGIAQPTVSKHLSILEAAGWVDKKRQEKNFIFYELIRGLAEEDPRAELLSLLSRWLLEDPELTALSRLAQDLNPQEILKKAGSPHSGLCRECGSEITQNDR
ncbi:MAG: metalloregulator ArsR/SmtB family transcription factor [Syntrophobacterales bacterium]|nr:metalloregulator ArsR/SmtB family transcription factor [Syntrophobacterales bacterium]